MVKTFWHYSEKIFQPWLKYFFLKTFVLFVNVKCFQTKPRTPFWSIRRDWKTYHCFMRKDVLYLYYELEGRTNFMIIKT